MSQHSSLRAGRRSKQHRSVLKRYERLKTLKEKNEWQEGTSVFGIPKVKTLRIKVKKEKAEAKPEDAAAAATAGASAAAEKGAPKAQAGKPAAAAKAPAAKEAAPKKEAKK